jgi:hypothetical protein
MPSPARNAGRWPVGDFGVVVGATTPAGAVRLVDLNGPALSGQVGGGTPGLSGGLRGGYGRRTNPELSLSTSKH